MAYILWLRYPAHEDETVNTEMFDFSVLQRDGLQCSSGQNNIEISQRSKDTETLDMPCMVAKKENLRQSNKLSHLRDWQANHVHFFLVQFLEDILKDDPIKRYDCLCLVPWGPFATPLYQIWHWEHDHCVTRNSRVFNSMRSWRRGLKGVEWENYAFDIGWRWHHNHHRESTNCSRRRWRCAQEGWNANPKVDKV